MSPSKTCTVCGETFPWREKFFGPYDKLCVTCRAEAGPMTFGSKEPQARVHPRLTAIESEVLVLRREGLTTLAIARRLNLMEHTVANHLSVIRGKGFNVPFEEEVAAL